MNEPALGMIDAKTVVGCFPPPGFRRGTGARRRLLSMPGEESACQHVMSRMVDGLAFWDDVEKEALDRLMRKMAGFLGVRLLARAVMGNHFHALVEIPNRERWLERFRGPEGEVRLWAHLATFYEKESLAGLRKRVDGARAAGRAEDAERILDAVMRRMCDVSIWAKEVKERYSRWLNRRRNRQGTVWMARFHNVLVETGSALRVVAAYIDLNPVRAGLVERPEDYRWCGLAAAVRGEAEAAEGIARMMSLAASSDVGIPAAVEMHGAWVELVLQERGQTDEGRKKDGPFFSRQRAFSEGMALGGEAWLEEVAGRHRNHFGCYRRGRPRRVPGLASTLVLRMDKPGG